MPASGEVAKTISQIEGFEVSFVDDNGNVVDDAEIASYRYQRAAKKTWTLAQWRETRIEEEYPDLWLVAWRPDGKEAHGRTLLETLRHSHHEAEGDGLDDESDAPAADENGLKRKAASAEDAGGDLADIERTLWAAADKLRGSMDAAEYKHVVLGLIFLKYVSDAYSEVRAQLEDEIDEGADPDDIDEYRWRNVAWVPPPAQWRTLTAQARQPTIGSIVDKAMDELEALNPALRGVLPKDYARPALDQQRLGQLIDLLGDRDTPCVAGWAVTASAYLASDFDEVIGVTGFEQSLRNAIDCPALGDGGQVESRSVFELENSPILRCQLDRADRPTQFCQVILERRRRLLTASGRTEAPGVDEGPHCWVERAVALLAHPPGKPQNGPGFLREDLRLAGRKPVETRDLRVRPIGRHRAVDRIQPLFDQSPNRLAVTGVRDRAHAIVGAHRRSLQHDFFGSLTTADREAAEDG